MDSLPLTGGAGHRLWQFSGEVGGIPEWNPAGTKIALTVDRPFSAPSSTPTPPGLWILDANGSHRHRVAADAHGDVAWSPDGRRLAYETAGPQGQGVFPARVETVSANGGTPKTIGSIINGAGDAYDLSWAHDGRTVLVSTPTPKAQPDDIQLLPVDGRGGHVLFAANPGGGWSQALYSPDGTRIAVIQSPDRLVLTQADGMAPVMVSEHVETLLGWIPAVDLHPDADPSPPAPKAPTPVRTSMAVHMPATSILPDSEPGC